MKSMKNQFNAVAGIPEKWLIVIEGYKMPGSNVWAEKNWLTGYLITYAEDEALEFPLQLLCSMDLLDLKIWLLQVIQTKALLPDFQMMDAYHRFKHLRRGKYFYVTYIYDELPAQPVHISFTIQEIKILCMQIEQLCLNFNVKD